MPIGAEARGRRRVLFRQLGEEAARLRENSRSDRAMELTKAWIAKRGKGRQRAQQHLVALFGSPRLITENYLGWLFLAPAGAGVQGEDPYDPGITQDCIAACILLAGVLPGRARREGSITHFRWNLEFSEHAVGRLLERSPKADPVEAMIGAHDALRRAGADIPPEKFLTEYWVPGGKWGAFACRPLTGTTDDIGTYYVRARTWLDADQLTDQYIVTDAAPSVERFGEKILLPGPLMSSELSDAIKRLWDVA